MAKSLAHKRLVTRIKAATHALNIGQTYFLSSFYEKDGAMVKVLAKSVKLNGVGWPSSVIVTVVEPLGDNTKLPAYAPGVKHEVNATNLYVQREHASAAYKYGRKVVA